MKPMIHEKANEEIVTVLEDALHRELTPEERKTIQLAEKEDQITLLNMMKELINKYKSY